MHAIHVPGNNPSNREVSFELAKRIKGFETSTILEHPHWYSDKPDKGVVDIGEGSDRLMAAAEGKGSDFIVVAKSIGTLLSLSAGSDSASFRPSYVVYMGAPLNDGALAHPPVQRGLTGYDVPSLWIQNEGDPYMGAATLKNLLSEFGVVNMDFVALDGDTHEYDPSAVAEIIHEHLPFTQEPVTQ